MLLLRLRRAKAVQEDVIKVCRNCHGVEPCQCGNKDYIEMVRWIYELMKKLNPMG